MVTGARRTEIAQLKVGDLRQAEGAIWFLDFTNEGEDQSLKNLSSARSVPIHAELIRLGLVEFVSARARTHAGTVSLWSGFEPPIEPKAKAWTKWFGRYLGA